jgi:hypothetical protein
MLCGKDEIHLKAKVQLTSEPLYFLDDKKNMWMGGVWITIYNIMFLRIT